ncbi:hypothetical protein E5222_14335 [Alteraurantiacibacter aquimixticola]|uniref:Uncharacterized protein n=1 Tax=Alteraurantiacibacter aquimixticola TaxID=2489173 RepID=A0A4T3EZD8_9SPHN|nr:hypothetical protein E5222_14335 [Alteraurantiacibacter aquimixticola]
MTWRAGFYIRVVGRAGTTNWFHFAIPTAVIVNDNRLRIDSAMLRYRCKSSHADVTNLHVFDGETKVLSRDGLNLSPTAWDFERFVLPDKPEVRWGVGVTVGVRFNGTSNTDNTMEFASAGVDFLP